MTKAEQQLQSMVDNDHVAALSRSWNRTQDEIDAACAALVTRRLATVAVSESEDDF